KRQRQGGKSCFWALETSWRWCASSSASYLPLLRTKRPTRSGGRCWRYLRSCGGTQERPGAGLSRRLPHSLISASRIWFSLQLRARRGVTFQDKSKKETPDENDPYPNRVGHIPWSNLRPRLRG